MLTFFNHADLYILTSWKQTTKSKDDSAFVLLYSFKIEMNITVVDINQSYLNDFDDKAEWYGEGGEDDEQGDEGDEVRAQAGALFTACWNIR